MHYNRRDVLTALELGFLGLVHRIAAHRTHKRNNAVSVHGAIGRHWNTVVRPINVPIVHKLARLAAKRHRHLGGLEASELGYAGYSYSVDSVSGWHVAGSWPVMFAFSLSTFVAARQHHNADRLRVPDHAPEAIDRVRERALAGDIAVGLVFRTADVVRIDILGTEREN